MDKDKIMTKITWTTARDNNGDIIGYQAAINCRIVFIERVDAIGEGVCYTVNKYVFDKLATAKAYATEMFGAL
jgi:hypothetical protein